MQRPSYNKNNIVNHVPITELKTYKKIIQLLKVQTGYPIQRWLKTYEHEKTYVMYSKNVDNGSVAWHIICLYSSTNLRVHFSTIVVVCKGEGSTKINTSSQKPA